GISYVELRIFDLNPFDAFGMSEQDMQFVHLFCMLMVWKEDTATMAEVREGKKMSDAIALEHPNDVTRFQNEGLNLIAQMDEMVRETNGTEVQLDCIQQAKNQLI